MTEITINKNTTAKELLKKIEKQGITLPLNMILLILMAYLPEASLKGNYLKDTNSDKVYINGSYLNKDQLIALLQAHRITIIEE